MRSRESLANHHQNQKLRTMKTNAKDLKIIIKKQRRKPMITKIVTVGNLIDLYDPERICI